MFSILLVSRLLLFSVGLTSVFSFILLFDSLFVFSVPSLFSALLVSVFSLTLLFNSSFVFSVLSLLSALLVSVFSLTLLFDSLFVFSVLSLLSALLVSVFFGSMSSFWTQKRVIFTLTFLLFHRVFDILSLNVSFFCYTILL